MPEAEPGVSDALARDRVARISGVHYTVTFRIPASKAEPIEGSEVITFELRDTTCRSRRSNETATSSCRPQR
ncbi:MAG: hypothetical protein DMF85_00975 [Acidobacteria bacterium]|nr:MAG: hypothetical protein DMF85_00975 [Acidobacteriota bacterium]